MSALNKVTLIGNLGADPELRHTSSGTAVCNMRLATNEKWRDKQGNLQEHTEWHRITVWGAKAAACAKYLGKGRQVYIEGKLRTRPWTDKQGVERYTTEVVATDVQFLGSAKSVGEKLGAEKPGEMPAAHEEMDAENFDVAWQD